MPRLRPPEANLRRRGVGRHLVLAALVLHVAACGDDQLSTAAATMDSAPPPEADRQSWDVRLQMRGPTSELVIVAPYLSDHLDVRQTRADSGAVVLLVDRSAAGGDTSRIEASSLVVDHKDGSVTFGGDVSITGTDLTLQTDSLRWERDTDSLTMTRRVEMGVLDGDIVADRLAGTTSLSEWQAEGVFGSFEVESADDSYRVGVEGRQAVVDVHGERVVADFDSVTSHWQGRRLSSHRAVYHGADQRLDFSGSVVVTDSGRALHTDTLSVDLRADRLRASGQVKLVEADRRIEARWLEDDEAGWQAVGIPVRVQTQDRELTAPVVMYDAGADLLSATGGVYVAEGDSRSMSADTLRLQVAEDELHASGVRLRADEFSGELSSLYLLSGQGGQVVELWGKPQLVRDSQGADAVTLQADTLRLDMVRRDLQGVGEFSLRVSQRLHLSAQRGSMDAVADTLRLQGQTIVHYQQEHTDQHLEGETVSIDLQEGQARSVRWPASLTGRLEDDRQTTWLKASAGALMLAEGRLDSLVLTGSPDVTHRGGDAERASRFRAEEMILIFAADGTLRQLEARGTATALSRLVDDKGQVAVNEVKGSRLLIDLLDGAVVAVQVLDEIEGRYLPPDPEKDPSESEESQRP